MIKLILLDVDGVMTDGNKIYDKDHNIIGKQFNDRDFTAIKRFKASEIDIVFMSGDKFNEKMADKRNIPFYYTRTENGLDKSVLLPEIMNIYNVVDNNEIAFVGDDIFDLPMFKTLQFSFCPVNSPNDLKYIAYKLLDKPYISSLYDILMENKLIIGCNDISKIEKIDRLDKISKEM